MVRGNIIFLSYFQDHLSSRCPRLAEFLCFFCLTQGHYRKESRFKVALCNESREFCQICRVAPHEYVDSSNSGSFGSRFIYRLNRRGEHSTILDNSIGTRECLSTY